MAGWAQRPSDVDWSSAIAALTGGGQVLLIAHVSPDADALGSALAVGLALRARGTSVEVSFGDDPFVLPRSLEGLPGQELLVPASKVSAPEVVASFDASSLDRLGVLGPVADAAPTFIAVDHHVSYTGFARTHLVDVSAPATAVLALDLVDRLGVELTSEIAAALYAGLVTDTGSFRFSATTPATHQVAARLLATGIRHDLIARRIYDDEPFGVLRMMGGALDRAVLEERSVGGLGMVWTVVTRADRENFALPLDATERVIDVLRIANEAEVAVVLKEDDSGKWRVSTRSKGRVDVGAICLGLAGGGHRYAAGYTATGGASSVLSELRVRLAEAPHSGE